VPAARAEQAPAKVNLTLHVLGRRADGYHDIESLVAFAGVGDALTLTPGRALALTVDDVMKLADEDPFRFSKWQARQMQIQRQAQDVWQMNQQREQEKSETFKTWAKEQDDQFTKKFPEFADAEKGPKLRASVTTYLTKEIGVPFEFTDLPLP